jgi:hypothetical protein
MESLKQPQEDPTDTVCTSETKQIMEEEKAGGEQGQDVPQKIATTTTTTKTMEEEEKDMMA